MRYHAYYLNNSHRDDQVLSYLFFFGGNLPNSSQLSTDFTLHNFTSTILYIVQWRDGNVIFRTSVAEIQIKINSFTEFS